MRLFNLLGAWLLMTCSLFAAEDELFLNFEFQLKNADNIIMSTSAIRAVTSGQEVFVSGTIRSTDLKNHWRIELDFDHTNKLMDVEVVDLGRISEYISDGNSNTVAQTLFETVIPFQGYGDHIVFEMDGRKFHVVITLVDKQSKEAEAADKE